MYPLSLNQKYAYDLQIECDDAGLCKAANEEHGRDLPVMNGIREDIKSIGVLDTGSHDYREALRNLSTRLKSLLV